jgi:hypothetical protein
MHSRNAPKVGCTWWAVGAGICAELPSCRRPLRLQPPLKRLQSLQSCEKLAEHSSALSSVVSIAELAMHPRQQPPFSAGCILACTAAPMAMMARQDATNAPPEVGTQDWNRIIAAGAHATRQHRWTMHTVAS